MRTGSVSFVRFGLVVTGVVTSLVGVGSAEARSIRDLGTLGGSSSFARGINQAGQIVGDATTAAGDTHAFLFTPWVGRMLWDYNHVVHDLGTLAGGNFSAAFGVNNGGTVVGVSSTATFDDHAVVWVP